jgi:hypothetical protein
MSGGHGSLSQRSDASPMPSSALQDDTPSTHPQLTTARQSAAVPLACARFSRSEALVIVQTHAAD